ncbi:MAG: class I SAM-dependent methyltransferase [Candidatus Omnitrophota bacterium]
MAQAPDRKMRYAGLLENPFISRLQRNVLDYGRWQGVGRVLAGLPLRNVLDVGCGLGENSRACAGGYVGIDNSAPRIFHAGRHYPQARFILGDGRSLPVKPNSFDLVMLLDTAHHLTDAQLVGVVRAMTQTSRARVLVSDPLLFEGQGFFSRFFYSLDRGAAFRTVERLQALILSCPGLTLERVEHFTTYLGLYRRAVILLKKEE